MKVLNINIKKTNNNAVVPTYAHIENNTRNVAEDNYPLDACFDLTIIDVSYNRKYDRFDYDFGLQFEIPIGYVMLILPKSRNIKTESYMPNSVGVIDPCYRGNVKGIYKLRDKSNANNFQEHSDEYIIKHYSPYQVGDDAFQGIILPYPAIKFNVVDKLSETNRGDGGFGSSKNQINR